MQFKHPELLYALFSLVIPIIVHLFKLRKFKPIDFTNVAFLKEANLKTRKSSQIKKWLILCTRLLLLAAIIFAFAQPFTTKKNSLNTKKDTIIYLDNSFSMQAKGNNGELLKRAVHDLITHIPEEENITLFTNHTIYKNTTIKVIQNELLQLSYSANHLSAKSALLKSRLLSKNSTDSPKNIILISDFQKDNTPLSVNVDSINQLYFIKLNPINTNNIAIDSAYISNTSPTKIELTVELKQSGKNSKNSIPISLFNDSLLIAKTAVTISDKGNTSFSLPTNTSINGKISINDVALQYDNNLFFNLNTSSKTNVLAINQANDLFLKRIYITEEFNYTSTPVYQLNYSLLNKQHLIILNELENIPNALISAINTFTKQGGSLIIIPSKSAQTDSYNTLLKNQNTTFKNRIAKKKQITTINYAHPIYNDGVFEKRISNFEYPNVSSFYQVTSIGSSIVLSFENEKPFLYQNQNTFIFTAPLNIDNTNFQNAPLIVPTFYNIAKSSFKVPQLYYTVGEENRFDVSTELKQDDILSLVNKTTNLIPKQQYANNKVTIKTSTTPLKAGTYKINNKTKTLAHVSYNYNRNESDLVYQNISNLTNVTVSDSIVEIFDFIKSDSKINVLWKWFVIFALALLLIEMLILKYFK